MSNWPEWLAGGNYLRSGGARLDSDERNTWYEGTPQEGASWVPSVSSLGQSHVVVPMATRSPGTVVSALQETAEWDAVSPRLLRGDLTSWISLCSRAGELGWTPLRSPPNFLVLGRKRQPEFEIRKIGVQTFVLPLAIWLGDVTWALCTSISFYKMGN